MIDWERLAELQADIGTESLAEVVEIFLAEMDATIADLGGHPDSAALADGLHALRGAAANVGFSVLADLAGQGEESARSGRKPADLRDLLIDVQGQYGRDRAVLIRELPSRAGVQLRR